MYFLYDVRMEPILYTTFLLILLVLPFVFRDLRNTYQKCERLNNIKQAKLPATPDLGAADTLVEESYQQIIKEILQTWQNETKYNNYFIFIFQIANKKILFIQLDSPFLSV